MGNVCLNTKVEITKGGEPSKESKETKEMAASSSNKLKTVVLLGSTREGRFGLRVAKFIKKQLEEANHSVDVLGNRSFLGLMPILTTVEIPNTRVISVMVGHILFSMML
jgi:hypothetical protein